MPINYKDYNPEWKKISKSIIKDRAKDKCELCLAPNGEHVFRPLKKYQDTYKRPWYETVPKSPDRFRFTKIVLTVHHIDRDKKNDDPLNLLALCQKCHLRVDLAIHVRNRKIKRAKGLSELNGDLLVLALKKK